MNTKLIITVILALCLSGCASSGPSIEITKEEWDRLPAAHKAEIIREDQEEARYRNAAMWGTIAHGLGNMSRAYQYRRPVTCYGGVNGFNSMTCY